MSYWTPFRTISEWEFPLLLASRAENSTLQLILIIHFSKKRESTSLEQPGQKFFPSHDSMKKNKHFSLLPLLTIIPLLSHTYSPHISVKR